LETEAWYEQVLADIKEAGEVELASYVYDHPALQAMLLKKLQGRWEFKLNIYVDVELYSTGGPRCQGVRLKALMEAGAQVYLCQGAGRFGSFHSKGLVVDRRVLYTGSANFTTKSTTNDEFCLRITGPVVLQFLEKLARHRNKQKPLTS